VFGYRNAKFYAVEKF